jgi:hypothetical protein
MEEITEEEPKMWGSSIVGFDIHIPTLKKIIKESVKDLREYVQRQV